MKNKSNILFEIKPSSGIPIYKQIIDQVERLVASGLLQEGEQLPSVRQVATQFDINPMTISKAYSLMEAKGIVERLRGKGMMISKVENSSQDIKNRLELIKPTLVEMVSQAKQLNLPNKEIIKLLKELLGDENE